MHNAIGERKSLVMDGCMRSLICDSRSFAMFWVIERTADKGESNLVEMAAQCEAKVTIKMPRETPNDNTVSEITLGASTLPLANGIFKPKPLKQGGRLKLLDGGHVKELCEKLANKALAQKKNDEDKKRRSRHMRGMTLGNARLRRVWRLSVQL